MAVILAVETATRLCSVAVGRNGEVLSIREEQSERLSHAEKINVFAAAVLEEAGLSLDQVDAFAVGLGPGSYTGSRIGVSAIKGWCYALEKPVIGITTLRTLAGAALDQGNAAAEIWPMIDARRMEVFTQKFDPEGNEMEAAAPVILDQDWVIDRADRTLVIGDGADKAVELWKTSPKIIHRPQMIASARYMLKEAERRYQAQQFDDLAYLVPQYGKAANVTQPGKKRS